MSKTSVVHRCGFLQAWEDAQRRLVVHVGGSQGVQPLTEDDVRDLVASLSIWLRIKDCDPHEPVPLDAILAYLKAEARSCNTEEGQQILLATANRLEHTFGDLELENPEEPQVAHET
jgi:hypothetical protein